MSNETSLDFTAEIVRSTKVVFVPFAFFDASLDCIRIELRDCSMKEVRLNSRLTLVFDNYPDSDQNPVAGIVIKGVKHLFAQHKLPLDGVYLVADLLDQIVKDMILDETSRKSISEVTQIAKNIEMPVQLAA